MILYKLNKQKELARLHKWFAWYPVEIEKTPDGDSKKAWLINVLRCRHYVSYIFKDDCKYKWKYKLIDK